VKKSHIDILLLIALIVLLFFPLWELNYRYVWDANFGNSAYGKIQDSGIFKNLWAGLTNDYDYMQIFGYAIKFPVVYVAILTQLILIFKRKWINQAVWLYVINAIFYGVCMYLFLLSFDRHKLDINIKIGGILYFVILAIGLLKEKLHIKS
jgi:uncharacterized membrane protein